LLVSFQHRPEKFELVGKTGELVGKTGELVGNEPWGSIRDFQRLCKTSAVFGVFFFCEILGEDSRVEGTGWWRLCLF
jgi:hypothetical protein